MPHLKHGLLESPDSLFNCQRTRRVLRPAAFAAVVSLGKLLARAHSVNFFFQLPSRSFAVRRAAVSVSGGAFLRNSVRPVNTFFQACVVSLSRPDPCPVSRGGGAIYPTASGPSTLFFKLPEEPAVLRTALRLVAAGRSLYPSPPSPSTRFFNFPAAAAAGPNRFPLGRNVSTQTRTTRQRLSAIPAWIFRSVIQN